MQEETKPAVSRRGLLRRAGTVAAGVGAAGVATAVAGSPAQAADGDALVIGQANTGSATTTLTAGNAANPAVKLANPNADGVPLQLQHVTLGDTEAGLDPAGLPVGSTYVDQFGDSHFVGLSGGAGPAKRDIMQYSATWATMTIPIQSFRMVDTRGSDSPIYGGFGYGTYYVQSGNIVGGKLQPVGGGPNTPDMVINFSDFILPGGFAAVQANLTIAGAAGDGFVALYSGTWLGTSSLNYSNKQFAIANFTQTALADDLTLSVKVQSAVTVILDIVGFIAVDPFAQGLPIAGQPRDWTVPPTAAATANAAGGAVGAKRAVAPRRD